MNIKFSIIGGDLRIIKLAKMLAKDNNLVYVYGLEKAKELEKNDNIYMCNELKEAINSSEIIIGPIPFSKNNKEINTPFSDKKIEIKEIIKQVENKILIAGAISNEIIKNKNIIDIMKQEELVILNTIATAEGTIELMIANTDKIIHKSNVLILGFGRVAKVLAKKLEALSVNITCAARKTEDLAWIYTYGYKKENINKLDENLKKYDIIINTVPYLIITKEKLEKVKKDCLIIDLASAPGGIDREFASENKIKNIWALAIPGKVAPITSAEIIKNTIYNLIK